MRRIAAVLVTVLTSIAAVLAVAPVASAAVPRLHGRFDTVMRVTASSNGERVGTKYTRVITLKSQCETGPCETELSRRRGDGVTIRYLVAPTETGYAGQHTYRAHCRLDSGRIVTDAFKYTERVTLTPKTLVAGEDRVRTWSAVMNLSFTPTVKGKNWNCRAGSQRMNWNGTLRPPAA